MTLRKVEIVMRRMLAMAVAVAVGEKIIWTLPIQARAVRKEVVGKNQGRDRILLVAMVEFVWPLKP